MLDTLSSSTVTLLIPFCYNKLNNNTTNSQSDTDKQTATPPGFVTSSLVQKVCKHGSSACCLLEWTHESWATAKLTARCAQYMGSVLFCSSRIIDALGHTLTPLRPVCRQFSGLLPADAHALQVAFHDVHPVHPWPSQYMGAIKNFESPWLRPWLLFPKFVMGFCSD